ncbi:DEAD/DEAH box helicase [Myxococcus qinghaiensis]|uniref:DEAD/DEAH box helicase n=1 Tax=Myxococcus qinghaiensis TaxID=2906758 RepID=UPI0020A7059C|nr:DEAD/DEAH box helicase [Myxococcus qinghaiensis]MCP3170157.1 DEAD/DEAH box helicase [Myxococcus qinghaiensis]
MQNDFSETTGDGRGLSSPRPNDDLPQEPVALTRPEAATLRVRVGSGLCLAAGEVPPKVLEGLLRALSLPNPAYWKLVRLGKRPGSEPEKLHFLQQQGREIRLPRGAIHLLRRLASEAGLTLALEDARTLPRERLTQLPAVPLRDYQAVAVEKLVKGTQGTVVLPCGAGKSVLAVGAMARLRTPTLVLVHTLDLAEQWREHIRTRLGLEAGLVGAGEEAAQPVTVAMVQALARWSDAKLDAFLARFGLLVLDEAHHVAASAFYRLVDRCPARYRLGLTATPEREDGLTPLLRLYLGSTLAVVSHEELVARGVLVAPEVRAVETAFDYPYSGADDYAPMLEALAGDDARNALVVNAVAKEARAGHVCLVLTGRVEHCEALARRLLARGIRAAALTSAVPKAERRALLEAAREGSLPVLVATSLADEGLDLPRLSRVFLVHPSRAKGRTVQRMGRLMRPHPEKQSAVLFDFVDGRVPLLRRHHAERQQQYAQVLGGTSAPATSLARAAGG